MTLAPDVVGPSEARAILGLRTRQRFHIVSRMAGFPAYTQLEIGRVWDRAAVLAWHEDRHRAGKKARTTMLQSYRKTGNVSRAARAAGVTRPTAARWLCELGVPLPRQRA